MQFEFDQNKSTSDKSKHGIDFYEAQLLWLDAGRLEIDAITIGEPRKLLIAKIDNVVWSAIFTVTNNRIRIISVRKSRNNEKEIYYNSAI